MLRVIARPSTGHVAAAVAAAGHATVRRDAPAIYGALLVTALLAVQWRSDATAELVAASILVSVFVFWMTHVWAEMVDLRVNGPLSRQRAAQIASAEAPMLTAAVPPVATLALARVLGVRVEDAIALALIVSIAQLFVWGLAIGRALDRGLGVALLIAAIECAFGLLLVGLKVVVVH